MQEEYRTSLETNKSPYLNLGYGPIPGTWKNGSEPGTHYRCMCEQFHYILCIIRSDM